MLSQLFINNIAVIEKSSIDFSGGFTVLSGETGAGKSIIIDAIHAILGERTSKELIRTGAESASVSALFTDVDDDVISLLTDMGLPMEEDQSLLMKREIKSEGKSICKINGAPATVSMLKTIGQRLVSIHGQHESYDLLSEAFQIRYLDSFGNIDDLLADYIKNYDELKNIQRQLEELNIDEGEKARRVDLLRYQIDEIEAAGVQTGEQERLTAERDTIKNSEKIANALRLVQLLLAGDEEKSGVLADLTEISVELDAVADYLPAINEISGQIKEASYMIEDAGESLRNLELDFDPSALDEIEARLDLLYKLILKYGKNEDDVLAFLETSQKELRAIAFADEERERLEREFERIKEQSIQFARELSGKRKNAAADFMKRVKQELEFLNMPGIEFYVDIRRVPLYSGGCDKIQFLISANKGEPAKPLSKIASGGELSRIMLAIKTVLAGKDKINTLIFDEIDAGISGEAANKVGQKLREVSQNRQVVCITHLAQIAALADHHLLITKKSDDTRTYTDVYPLDTDGRKKELARIIGGEQITETTLRMAEEMINK